MRIRVSVLVAALSMGIVGSAHAQDIMPYCVANDGALGFGPTLLPASGWSRIGFQVGATGCVTGHAQIATSSSESEGESGFPFSYGLHADASYLWANESVEIPDANAVRASGAFSLSISKPERRAPLDLHPDSLRTWDGGGFNLGFVDVGATVGYEASVDRSEQHLTAGLEGRYAINAAGWGRLLPSVVVRYEWVNPTTSEVRDAQGLPGDTHTRWSVRGYWNTALDFIADGLQNVRLQADASVFRARGLEQELVLAGWEDGEYAAVTLRYVTRQELVGLPGLNSAYLWLNSVYLRYSVGQLPTDSNGRDAFSLGVAIGVGR